MLLDQHVVAGLGNIYADEALFAAGIHPLRSAAALENGEIDRLHAAIIQVLRSTVGGRGTTLRDYRPPYGDKGRFQDKLARVPAHGPTVCALWRAHLPYPRYTAQHPLLLPVPEIGNRE